MVDIPFGVDKALPLYKGATYSVVEDTRVKKANPLASAHRGWTTLTKHELVIINSVSGTAGVHGTVIADEQRGKYDVIIPKRTWKKTMGYDMHWKILQFPPTLGFCRTIHAGRGSTVPVTVHALVCDIEPHSNTRWAELVARGVE